ncbi:PIR Superfamily Protein [Plasmodium ovale wallikeri]|uniref:PIR Superfamily Protein n=1 Tax=Plasmodium ovale wallikeri TaxID=864142 RepID=A0A1A9AGM5_PLAOA|nr:PIR Superfamily Protein [Plasmodium ovale wallikeri]
MDSEYITVDNYYPLVSLFDVYSEKFKAATAEDTEEQSYGNKCDQMKTRLYYGDSFNKERCISFLKYIKHLSQNKSDKDINKHCAYLNYLLNCEAYNDKIPKEYKPNYIYSYLPHLSSSNNVCSLGIELIDDDIFKKLKDTHNMYTLLKEVKSKETSCTGECCTNAKKCADTYESYIHNCYIGSTDNFCVELSKIKDDYEGTIKKVKVTCTDARELLTPPMRNNSGVSILIPCTILLVIPCFLFILYKFTPFSSWITPQIQKIKRIINNTEEQNENLILDNFDLMQYPQEKGPYNIAYNSSKNS